MESLSLAQNQLSGPIPAELSELKSLTSLDLSENRLTGPLDAGLGSLAHLETWRRIEQILKPTNAGNEPANETTTDVRRCARYNARNDADVGRRSKVDEMEC